MRRHLAHGALAGTAGGLAMAAVLAIAGEGPIGRAIAIEAERQPTGGAAEMFGRGAQQAGGAAAAVLYGLAVGIVFSVVFAAVSRRLASGGDWRAAMGLAVTGLATVFVVPFLKYPANPPAVGNPSTIGRRTLLYVVLLAWSVVASWATWRAWRSMTAKAVPEHLRVPATAATYLALVGAGFLALPASPDVIDVPATLVWQFRLASLAGTSCLWLVTGTVFGWLRLREAAAPGVQTQAVRVGQDSR
ncbi:MAG: CbtA family protein [Acidimicrobiales bacterium]